MPVLILIGVLTGSCENSLNDIQKITSKEAEKPISRSLGVDVIVSDSAEVKARMTTPLMIDFDDLKKPYREMPKGVKIIFYEADLKEKGSITSDYALQHVKEGIIEFRKNVVAKNAEGTVFKSEELFYNESTKQLYSTKDVQIDSPNGDRVNGTGYHSNVSMFPWYMDNTTAIIHVNEKAVQ